MRLSKEKSLAFSKTSFCTALEISSCTLLRDLNGQSSVNKIIFFYDDNTRTTANTIATMDKLKAKSLH